MSSEAPTDGGSFAWRTSLAVGLWLVAVALTYGASGMSWISSPDHDSRFPDPVWGEDLLHRGAAPGALVMFIGAAAMLVCWWLSGKVGTFGHTNPRSRIRVATRAARILRLALILLLLPSARGLALGWGEDWVGYPGWSRSLIAQLCALVAVLLLPRPDDPRRGAEAGYGRLRITVAGILVLACLSLPLLPAALASASAETSGTTSTPTSSTDPVSTSPESSRIRWAQVTLPLEGGDTGSTNSAASVAVGATWWHRWRGATAVRLIPTVSGDSVAALVENSAPNRTALAVLGQATGATLTSWDVHALDGRGLSADPSSADHLRLFGAWLVDAGALDEW
ncbi:MAG: hypothetical protein L0K65_08705, partial [Actinomyces sp.]|nr:hypothetical protein [Actinomyces sp.]